MCTLARFTISQSPLTVHISMVHYQSHVHISMVHYQSKTEGSWGYEQQSHLMRLWYFSSSHKPILQTRMRGNSVGQDVWFLVGPFVYFHISWVRTAKALARLCRCTGWPEPLLVTDVVSTIISWAGTVEVYDRLPLEMYTSEIIHFHNRLKETNWLFTDSAINPKLIIESDLFFFH